MGSRLPIPPFLSCIAPILLAFLAGSPALADPPANYYALVNQPGAPAGAFPEGGVNATVAPLMLLELADGVEEIGVDGVGSEVGEDGEFGIKEGCGV